MKKHNEANLITDAKAREQHIDRIEVLDTVGGLLTLPTSNEPLANMSQLTEFFKAPLKTIQNVVDTHMEELTLDGCRKFRKDEVIELLIPEIKGIKTGKGKTIATMTNGDEIQVASSGLRLFTKRSILRVAMLLRDSEVAKEIRTQLLNVIKHVEKESPQLLVRDKNEEDGLLMEVGRAMMNGDVQGLMVANTKLNEFKDRHKNQEITRLTEHVQKLETKVDILVDGIVNYDGDLKELFKICARALDNKRNLPFGTSYNEIYTNLSEKTAINVYTRKRTTGTKKPLLSFIMGYEWNEVIKVTIAYCESTGIDMKGLFESKLDNRELTTV